MEPDLERIAVSDKPQALRAQEEAHQAKVDQAWCTIFCGALVTAAIGAAVYFSL